MRIDLTARAGYAQGGLDLQAFQRGDMTVLGEVVDAHASEIWRLSRRGFLANEGEQGLFVQGTDSPDAAEALVIKVLAALLTPAQRAELTDPGALHRKVLETARARLIAHGHRSGRSLTLATSDDRAQVPEGVEDLDALIESDARPSEAVFVVDAGTEQRAREALATVSAAVESLDERSRELRRLRWVEARSKSDIARTWGCGVAAVSARERRVRHQARHALRKAFPEDKFGPAAIDQLLSEQPLSGEAHAVTLERVKKEILKRTFQEEPASYGQRAIWGFGALIVAVVLLVLMLMGVLPSPASDVRTPPSFEVKCDGACAPGRSARIVARVPSGMSQLAVLLVREGQKPAAWLADPTGGSVLLPTRFLTTQVEVPYPVTIPADLAAIDRVGAIAIFSADELSSQEILAAARGTPASSDVATASIALSLDSTR